MGDQEVVTLHELFQEIVNDTAPTASELDSVCMQIDIIGRLFKKIVPNRASTRATIARLAELRSLIGGDDRNGHSAAIPGQDQQPTAKQPAVQHKPPKRRPGGEGMSG